MWCDKEGECPGVMVARGVMSLTLCITVVMISEEMHALEGLDFPLFERAEGIGNC